MPISTGFLDKFNLVKYSDGFILQYPNMEAPNVISKFKESKKILQTFKDYEDRYKALRTIYIR